MKLIGDSNVRIKSILVTSITLYQLKCQLMDALLTATDPYS